MIYEKIKIILALLKCLIKVKKITKKLTELVNARP